MAAHVWDRRFVTHETALRLWTRIDWVISNRPEEDWERWPGIIVHQWESAAQGGLRWELDECKDNYRSPEHYYMECECLWRFLVPTIRIKDGASQDKLNGKPTDFDLRVIADQAGELDEDRGADRLRFLALCYNKEVHSDFSPRETRYTRIRENFDENRDFLETS